MRWNARPCWGTPSTSARKTLQNKRFFPAAQVARGRRLRRDPPPLALRACERRLEILLACECALPAIAGRRQPLDRVGDAEIERVRLLELAPGERHRDRRSRR